MSDRATFLDDLEAAGVRVRRPPHDWRHWRASTRRLHRAADMTAKAFRRLHLNVWRPSDDETTHSLTDHRPARL